MGIDLLGASRLSIVGQTQSEEIGRYLPDQKENVSKTVSEKISGDVYDEQRRM